MQQQLYERLRVNTPMAQPELQDLWEAAALERVEAFEQERKVMGQDVPAQYMVLLMCRDEGQQLALLDRSAARALSARRCCRRGQVPEEARAIFV
jgi:hypothetical protein